MSKKWMSLVLGLSSGLLIYMAISMFFQEAVGAYGIYIALGVFAAGALTAALLDKFLPHNHDAHETEDDCRNEHLYRLGIISAVSIGIHNFLEGAIIYLAFQSDFASGLVIFGAIMAHTVPLLLSIYFTVYFATKKVTKGLLIAFYSLVPMGVGALLFNLFVYDFAHKELLFAYAGGLLLYTAIDQLTAKERNEHFLVYGVIVGVISAALILSLMPCGGHAHGHDHSHGHGYSHGHDYDHHDGEHGYDEHEHNGHGHYGEEVHTHSSEHEVQEQEQSLHGLSPGQDHVDNYASEDDHSYSSCD
jgi:ZIP family zinc transporter